MNIGYAVSDCQEGFEDLRRTLDSLKSSSVELQEERGIWDVKSALREIERYGFRSVHAPTSNVDLSSPDNDKRMYSIARTKASMDQSNLVSAELGFRTPDSEESEVLLGKLEERAIELKEGEIFWAGNTPNWEKLRATNLSEHSYATLNQPNDLMLRPWNLRQLVVDLRRNSFSVPEIVNVIAAKYTENHGWDSDLTKNDLNLRAEYWVRTSLAQA